MFCTACGDLVVTRARGDGGVELLLWLLLCLPGLIYSAWRYSGWKCCRCGSQALIPADSPNARRMMDPSQNLRTCSDCGKEVSIHAELCPHGGMETKLFTSAAPSKVPSPIPQKRLPEIRIPLPVDSPLARPAVVKQKRASQLAKLTEATIRSRTKSGDTPLHRAAKTGRLNEVPSHLLKLELFLARNNREETPLHLAAKHGCLNQVSSEFLTKETVTALDYYGRTPLHVAAAYGHADQIPREFLTPEFLNIPTKNFTSNTILHIVAGRNELAKLPSTSVTAKMWDVENGYGETPRGLLETKLHESDWRSDPATEKQKAKLRFFGCNWDEGITKGQASDAIEECVEKLPDVEAAYQNRPATKEQRAKLRSYGEKPDEDPDDPLTYEQAKELIQECEISEQQEYLDELEKEYIIDVEDWAELYPGLTWKRVQNAAKALDEARPGWRDDKDNFHIMLSKVAELNPKTSSQERS